MMMREGGKDMGPVHLVRDKMSLKYLEVLATI